MQTKKIIQKIDNGLTATTNLLHRLTLKQYKIIDLVAVFRELFATINSSSTIFIRFNAQHFNESEISQECKINIFWIVRTQINNILKYSEAKVANVAISNNKYAVNVLIHNDGVGFDRKEIKNRIGLHKICIKTENFGGKVEIISASEKGFSLFVRFPVHLATERKAISKQRI